MSDVNYTGRSRSERWQDWCNLVLAVWLFISPWVLGFATGGAAAGPATAGNAMAYPAWNAWVFGVISGVVALSAMFSMRPWQEWINLLIGIWLFIAPWVLHFGALGNPAWDHWVVGVLMALVSLSALSNARGASVVYAGDKPYGSQPPPTGRNPNDRF